MSFKSKIIRLLNSKPYYNENKYLFPLLKINGYLRKKLYNIMSKYKKKYTAGKEMTFEEILLSIEKLTMIRITDTNPNGKETFQHLGTGLHSKTTHGLLGQKTLAKALLCRYKETEDMKYFDLLIEVVGYCINYREESGIYRWHLKDGMQQDEGPVTAGMIQVLCETYELTNNEKFLEEAIISAEASLRLIYDENKGFLHTRGVYHQVTNINSSYAQAFAHLYYITRDRKWQEWTGICVDKTLELQDINGMFMYSDVHPIIFRSLYHFMVVNALHQIYYRYGYCDESVLLSINKGELFGKSLVRNDGSIKDDDMDAYSFLPSNTRALACYIFKKNNDLSKNIINFMGKFFTLNDAYLFIDGDKIWDKQFYYRKEFSIVDIYFDLAYVSMQTKKAKISIRYKM